MTTLKPKNVFFLLYFDENMLMRKKLVIQSQNFRLFSLNFKLFKFIFSEPWESTSSWLKLTSIQTIHDRLAP